MPPAATALAAKSTTSGAAAPPAEALAAPHDRRAERAAGSESATAPPVAAPAPLGPPPPEAASGERGHHTAPAGVAAPAPAPSITSSGARHADSSAQPAHAHARPGTAHAAPGASASGEAGESAGVPGATSGAATSGASTQSVEALARQKKGSGGGEKGGGKKQKEKAKGKGKGKEAETEGGSTQPGGEVEAVKQQGVTVGEKRKSDLGAGEAQTTTTATADAATAAQLSTPVTASASPSSGVAETSIASVAPSVEASARQRTAYRGARGRRAKRIAAAAQADGGVASVLSTASAAASSANAPHASRPTQTAAARTRASSAQPAIVKTITKLVGVVPAPVRILIGALIALALALGLRSLLASIRTRRLVRQRGELLEDVGLLQAALLPQPPPRLGPVGTSVSYRPADGPGAGGDFYDVFALADGRLAVIVGDVSGHGREALPHTALVRFTVRAYLEAGLTPGDALQTAGVVLERQLADSFATVVAAVYHPRERTLTYATAGHPPPLVIGEPSADGTFERAATVTSCAAPPIGAQQRTGTRQTVIDVPGAARLCFHTDGVTEARVGGELFGAERLARTLASLEADGGAAELLDSVAAQSDARPDDMAACVLHVHGDAIAPSIAHERVELDGASLQRARVEQFLRDSDLAPARVATALEEARAALASTDSAVLELRFEQGAPIASVSADSVTPARALTVVRAS
jgi:serine phosphatase RsbU (regulator of sigma subunit)